MGEGGRGRWKAVEESGAYSQPGPTAQAPGPPPLPPSCVLCRPLRPLSFRSLRDRRADQIPPLRPRAVVVTHLFHAEQVFEGEPRVARALSEIGRAHV